MKKKHLVLALVPFLLLGGCMSQSARMGMQNVRQMNKDNKASLNLQNKAPQIEHLRKYIAASESADYYFNLLNQYLVDVDKIDVIVMDPATDPKARAMADETFAKLKAELLREFDKMGLPRTQAIVEVKKREPKKYDPFLLLKTLPPNAAKGSVYAGESFNIAGKQTIVDKRVVVTFAQGDEQGLTTQMNELSNVFDLFLSHDKGWLKTGDPRVEQHEKAISINKRTLAVDEQALRELGNDTSAYAQKRRASITDRMENVRLQIERSRQTLQELDGQRITYQYKWNSTGNVQDGVPSMVIVSINTTPDSEVMLSFTRTLHGV